VKNLCPQRKTIGLISGRIQFRNEVKPEHIFLTVIRWQFILFVGQTNGLLKSLWVNAPFLLRKHALLLMVFIKPFFLGRTVIIVQCLLNKPSRPAQIHVR
jgi:hypothetical protein